jgi:Poxvirus Late Transcription Factor VLTF3 like/Ring finger domain
MNLVYKNFYNYITMSARNKPTYTKTDHFRYMLGKFQGKNSNVPLEVIDEIQAYVVDHRIQNIDASIIRAILKEQKMIRYLQDVPFILSKLKLYNMNDEFSDEKPADFECPICLETDVLNVKKLDCSHILCHSCVLKITVNSSIKCPLCRRQQILNSIQIANVAKLTKEQEEKIIKMAEVYLNDYENGKIERKSSHINFSNLIQELASKV